MITDRETMELAVKQAADVLTELYPSWERAIDLYTLEMSDSCSCVLGQLGEYEELFETAAERVDEEWILAAFDLHRSGEESIELDWESRREAWETLRQVWDELIRSRR